MPFTILESESHASAREETRWADHAHQYCGQNYSREEMFREALRKKPESYQPALRVVLGLHREASVTPREEVGKQGVRYTFSGVGSIPETLHFERV